MSIKEWEIEQKRLWDVNNKKRDSIRNEIVGNNSPKKKGCWNKRGINTCRKCGKGPTKYNAILDRWMSLCLDCWKVSKGISVSKKTGSQRFEEAIDKVERKSND